MRFLFPAASALLLVSVSAAATAQPAPEGEPQEPPAAQVDTQVAEKEGAKDDTVVVTGIKEKKVCTRQKQTGSRFPVKVCRTVKEAEEETQATREVMMELQLAGGPEVEDSDPSSGVVGPVANPF